VDDLAARFEVTPQTIRKDLNELCEMRLLSRVHGDTIVLSGIENIYEARRLIAQNEKRAIGIAAAKIIANNASLFINIGTTIEEVARARRTRDLLVIANDLNVAMPLYRHPWIEVIVAGHPMRRSDGAVIG
jgi:DeoR family glycerol-3-phosphate regulon repressor